MAQTCRNIHQLLKWKELHSTLHGVCTQVLCNLTAVLKDSAAKGRQPRPPLLHLYPMRNSTSKEDGSGHLQTMPTKEPTSLQHPPR
jgi:hypothetical protein